MLPLLLSIRRRCRLSIINRWENPRLLPRAVLSQHGPPPPQFCAIRCYNLLHLISNSSNRRQTQGQRQQSPNTYHHSASYRATPTSSPQTVVAACGGAGASGAGYQKQNPYRHHSIPPHQPQHHQLPLPHMARHCLSGPQLHVAPLPPPAYGAPGMGMVGMERSATPTSSGAIGTTVSGSNGSNSNAVFGFAGGLDGMVRRCNSNSSAAATGFATSVSATW